jgi:hypothetical protein
MEHSFTFKGKFMNSRTVNRGANPYAPIVIQQNAGIASPSTNCYEALSIRGARAHANAHVQHALNNLRIRLNGQKYTHRHFGELLWVKISELDINIEIQRDEDAEHQANILEKFDPRIAMPVMATKLKNGRYSVWEGQQTSCLYYHLYHGGLIDGDFLVQIKAFDEDMTVPGTTLQGEAVGNYGFRQINGGGRKGIDAYHLHRSRVQGVRLYGSNFDEDIQSETIQCVLEKNNMFPAKASEARGTQALPGMVTYIHGLNTIAGHGSDMKTFDKQVQDLDWALSWHNKYYPLEKGVDGGFILAFGRLAHHARINKQPVTLDHAIEQDLFQLFKNHYGSPKGFHKDCKQRLQDFQDANDLVRSWSDSCLTPILVMDYYDPNKHAGKLGLPVVPDTKKYAGY